MQLKHDSQGFLIGVPVGNRPGDEVPVLERIEDGVDETNALLKSMLGQLSGTSRVMRRQAVSPAPRVHTSQSWQRNSRVDPLTGVMFNAAGRPAGRPAGAMSARAFTAQPRGADGRFIRSEIAAAVVRAGHMEASRSKAVAISSAARDAASARADSARQQQRGSDGRFGGDGGSGGRALEAVGSAASMLRELAGGALRATAQANIDPATAAAKELKDLAEPIFRPMLAISGAIARKLFGAGWRGAKAAGKFAVGGGSDDNSDRGGSTRSVSLRNRITQNRLWRSIAGGNTEQHQDSKAEQARLKEIADKSGESGRNSLGIKAVLGLMLTAVMGLGGLLVRGFTSLVGSLKSSLLGGALRMLGGPAARAAAGMGMGSIGGSAGVGAAGAGAAGAAGGGILARAGQALKSGAAGAGRMGMAALKKIPGVGAALALAVGGAGLIDGMLNSDDPTKSADENRAGRFGRVGGNSGSVVGAVAGGALGSLLGPLGTAVGAYLGEQVGDKIGAKIGEVLAKPEVWGKVTAAAEALSGAASRVVSWFGFAKPADGSDPRGVENIMSRRLGAVSMAGESGGNFGKVGNTRGDPGGASYGAFQFASGRGVVQDFLSKSGYAKSFAGLQPGSKEFDAVWTDLGKDGKFADAQYDYAKANYYDPAISALAGLQGRGRSVQEMVFATAVQFGATSGTDVIKRALAGKDLSKMDDAAVVNAVQDSKVARNADLFKSAGGAIPKRMLERAQADRMRLLSADLDERPYTKPAQDGLPAVTSTPGNQAHQSDVRRIDQALAAAMPAVSAGNPGVAGGIDWSRGQGAVLAQVFGQTVGSGAFGGGAGWLESLAAPKPFSGVPGRIPESPNYAMPSAAINSEPARPIEVYTRQPVSQSLPDRHIAHIVEGGIGGGY